MTLSNKNPELDTTIPKIELDIKTTKVQTPSRKLKVQWVVESATDLRAAYSGNTFALLKFWLAKQTNLITDEQAASDPQTSPEVLGICVADGTWEVASAALRNPNLPLTIWCSYLFINPSEALQNSALDLWLLEENFVSKLDAQLLMFLVTSEHFTGSLVSVFIESPVFATNESLLLMREMPWLDDANKRAIDTKLEELYQRDRKNQLQEWSENSTLKVWQNAKKDIGHAKEPDSASTY